MMIRARRWSAVVGAVVAAAVAIPLAQQAGPQPPAQSVFRATTGLVPVDVRVVDAKGKIVRDLGRDDFTVVEDGRPQRIQLFETQTLAAEAPTPGVALPRRRSQTDDIAPQNYRVFLIVLGRGRLQNVAGGFEGAVHLVRDRLLPQDRVAVLAWNRATEFTIDHARIVEILKRAKAQNNAIETMFQQTATAMTWVYGNRDVPPALQREIDKVFGDPGSGGARTLPAGETPDPTRPDRDPRLSYDLLQAEVGGRSVVLDPTSQSFDAYVARSAQTNQDLTSLSTALEYLRQIGGEKHLLWITEYGVAADRADADLELARSASDARVAIDIISAGGTESASNNEGLAEARRPTPVQQINQRGLAALVPAMASRTLAQQTGGRFDANRFANASGDVDAIVDSTSFQYLLGYYPAPSRWDGRYHNITVRVNRPGLRVMYRHGYFANNDVVPLNTVEARTYSRLSGAARYEKDIADIKLEATAVASKQAPFFDVQVSVAIDISRLTFENRGGRNTASVDFMVLALDKGQKTVGSLATTAHLDVTDARKTALTGPGIPVKFTVQATSEPRFVKVVAYDAPADLVGSTTVKLP